MNALVTQGDRPPPDIVGPGPCYIAAIGTILCLGMMLVQVIRNRKKKP